MVNKKIGSGPGRCWLAVLFLLSLTLSLVPAQPVFASNQVIDSCSSDQSVSDGTYSDLTPVTSFLTPATGVLGNERDLSIENNWSDSSTAYIQVTGGNCHAEGIGANATAKFQYDAVDGSMSFPAGSGLGEDWSSRDRFRLTGVTESNIGWVTVTVEDTSGNTDNYDASVSAGTVEVLFSNFTGIDWSSVRGVELSFAIGINGYVQFDAFDVFIPTSTLNISGGGGLVPGR